MKSKQPLSKLKRTIGASLAAVALLATTACDADKATNPQSGGIDGAREAIEKIQTDDALAERLPDKYTSSISVGMTFTFPPMRYMEGGEQYGAEYDLMDAVLKKVGVEMEVKEVSFDGLIPALKADRIDLAMESFADLPERRKEVSFVDYYRSATSLMVKKGNPLELEGLPDTCGHSIALQQGVESVQRAKTQDEQCQSDGKESVNIELFESSNDATLAVVNGRADATGNDYPAALNEAKTVQDGEALELVDKPISSDYFYGIGTRKEDTELQKVLKDAVQALMDSGEYTTILEAYGVEKGAIDKSGINAGPSKG